MINSYKLKILELKELLLTRRPDIITLREFLTSYDEDIIYLVMQFLNVHLDLYPDPSDIDKLEKLIPLDITSFTPDLQIVIFQLFAQFSGSKRFNQLKFGQLIPVVEVEYIKAAIIINPEMVDSFSVDKLRTVLKSFEIENIPEPERLIKKLCNYPDLFIQNKALHFIEQCLENSIILPCELRKFLLSLLDSEFTGVVTKALLLLGQPWSIILSCPEKELKKLLNREYSVVSIVLKLLAKWNNAEVFLEIITSSEYDPYLRRVAIKEIVLIKYYSFIKPILILSLSEPYFYGDDCIKSLTHYYRQGILLNKYEINYLINLWIKNTKISAKKIAVLLRHVSPDWWINIIISFPEEPDWRRFIELLEMVGTIETSNILTSLLSDIKIKYLRPEIIQALKRLEFYKAEHDILLLIDEEPDSCFDALKYIGGQKTIKLLQKKLFHEYSVKTFTENDNKALLLLTQLSDNKSKIVKLLKNNFVSGLNSNIFSELIMSLNVEPDSNMVDYLTIIALDKNNNDLRINALNQLSQIGNRKIINILGSFLSDSDEVLVNSVTQSIHSLGRRLYIEKRIRPICLLYASNQKEAGDYIFAEAIIRQLENPDLNENQVQSLLEKISGITYPFLNQKICKFIDSQNPHLRKFVIKYLGNSQDTNILPVLLKLLKKTTEVFTLRQLIIAFGKLNAFWANEEIAGYLEHPNMNIKKTAAEVLIKIGDSSTAPKLLKWLKIHDNSGFRELLISALKNILKSGYTSTLLNEISLSDSNREQSLLINALDGQLEISVVLNVFKESVNGSELLLAKIFNEDIALKKGDLTELNCQLIKNNLITQAQNLNDIFLAEEIIHLSKKDYVLKLNNSDIFLQLDNFIENKNLKNVLNKNQEEIFHSLYQNNAALSTDEARLLIYSKSKSVRHWAMETIIVDSKISNVSLNEFLNIYNFSYKEALKNYLERSYFQDVLNFSLTETSTYINYIRSIWNNFNISEELTLSLLFKLFTKANKQNKKEIISWISSFDNLTVENFLMKLLQSQDENLQYLAINYLEKRYTKRFEQLLEKLVNQDSLRIRIESARVLLKLGRKNIKLNLITKFIEGKLGNDFGIKAEFEELQAVILIYKPLLEKLKNDNIKLQQLEEKSINRITSLVYSSNSFPEELILVLLYTVQNNQESLLNSKARIKLSSLPTLKLWAYLKPLIYHNNIYLLDLLKELSPINSELLELLKYSNGETKIEILKILFNLSLKKPLEIPGLDDELLKYYQSWPEPDLPLKLLFSLKEWQLNGGMTILSDKLLTFFKSSDKEKKLELMNIFSEYAPIHFLQRNDFVREVKKYCKNWSDSEIPVNLLLKITNWNNRDNIEKLLEFLKENKIFSRTLNSSITAIINNLKIQPLAWQAVVLNSLISFRSFTEPVIIRLAEIQLEEYSIRDYLSPLVQFKVHEHLINNLSQKISITEIRDIINNLMLNSDQVTIELLIKISLTYKYSSIRTFTLKNLKNVLSKEKYMELVKRFLKDKQSELQKYAIRILSFANYSQAASDFIILLFHKNRTIRIAAQEGLTMMGNSSLPALNKELKNARPDRRETIQNVINTILKNSFKS